MPPAGDKARVINNGAGAAREAVASLLAGAAIGVTWSLGDDYTAGKARNKRGSRRVFLKRPHKAKIKAKHINRLRAAPKAKARIYAAGVQTSIGRGAEVTDLRKIRTTAAVYQGKGRKGCVTLIIWKVAPGQDPASLVVAPLIRYAW